MKYYRIKEKYDNVNYYIKRKNYLEYGGFFVGNELFTEKEFCKLKENTTVKDYHADIVNIPKSKVHTFFGARFENKGE